MGSTKDNDRDAARRTRLTQLREKHKDLQHGQRTDERGFSLEGLRLGSLLSQLQALQAVKGLQELRPKPKDKGVPRYEFSEDKRERASQKQWLMFKADWLEALLEDTITELDALEKFEAKLEEQSREGQPPNEP